MKLTKEPAAYGAMVIALVTLVATWPNAVVDAGHLPLVIAVVDGGVAAVVAWRVRPVAPSVVIAVTTPVAALLAGYGIDLPPSLIGTVNVILVPALLGLVARAQQSPVASLVPISPKEGFVR
jgi:hypothetical protein